MFKFEYTPKLKGLNLVTINEVSVKENSKGEYLDIEVTTANGKVAHIFNNINDNTKGYVAQQLQNLGDQLELPDTLSDKEFFKAVKGKEAEIEVQTNGFHIYPYTQLSTTIEEGGEL